MIKDLFKQVIIEQKVYGEGIVTLKSGIESDYYYDFGQLCDAECLAIMGLTMNEIIIEHGLENEITCFFTSAYKGIAITIALLMVNAVELSKTKTHNIKMGYLRKEKKTHGDGKLTIGHVPTETDTVLLIDDVFTSGYSIMEMVKFLEPTECKLAGVIVLINREIEPGRVAKISENIGAPIYCAVTHDEIQAFIAAEKQQQPGEDAKI